MRLLPTPSYRLCSSDVVSASVHFSRTPIIAFQCLTVTISTPGFGKVDARPQLPSNVRLFPPLWSAATGTKRKVFVRSRAVRLLAPRAPLVFLIALLTGAFPKSTERDRSRLPILQQSSSSRRERFVHCFVTASSESSSAAEPRARICSSIIF